MEQQQWPLEVTIPEHDLPSNAATPRHAMCKHPGTPENKTQLHVPWTPQLCRLDSYGYEVAADDQCYSDESQGHPAGCSQDILALPPDVSDTSSDELPLSTSSRKVGERQG